MRSILAVVLVLTSCPALGADRPNVLLVMADDLGFSDLGCYGGEIETPVLDGLAADGIRYTQFYNTARCWPTRAALLTGYYAQQVRRDAVPGIPSGGGNRGRRPSWAPLVSKTLQSAGYRTYHSGKWHIDSVPLESGFDQSYTLWRQGNFFRPKRHEWDGHELPRPTENDDYYGTVAIADYTIEMLKSHSAQHSDDPFFAYVAFTAPHFPLHALPKDIEKYDGRYDGGWEVIRQRRFDKQRELGLLDATLSKVERDQGPPYAFPDAIAQLGPGEINRPLPWGTLTDTQKAFQADKMEVHAAMVDRMDQELGRILDQLETMGERENTVVMFLSDNGASAEIMVRDDGHDPSRPLGSEATYPCLGPGWSTVCNTPFRKHKTWVHEGGCATPLVVSWPEAIDSGGRIRNDVGHVVDIVPTLLEVVGVHPALKAKPTPPGESFAGTFSQQTQTARGPLWWMHDGHRAYRVGQWKIVAVKGKAWELYDLSEDRTETNDLSSVQPDRVGKMVSAWETMWRDIQETAKGDG